MSITATPAEMQCKVKNFLKSLGTGPNKIAENLKEMKIKGYRSEARDCPIAKVIRKTFKNLKNIMVYDFVEFNYHNEECIVIIPAAVNKFVSKFDKLYYPELTFKN